MCIKIEQHLSCNKNINCWLCRQLINGRELRKTSLQLSGNNDLSVDFECKYHSWVPDKKLPNYEEITDILINKEISVLNPPVVKTNIKGSELKHFNMNFEICRYLKDTGKEINSSCCHGKKVKFYICSKTDKPPHCDNCNEFSKKE